MHTVARLCWGAVMALFALPLAAQQPPGLDVPYVATPPEVVARMLALRGPGATTCCTIWARGMGAS
ncbi:MAG TPA: hypothetical protein VGB92_11410 [Longimicrobium sp.]